MWPIGDGERFQGVLERETKLVHLFERGDRTGKATDLQTVPVDDPELEEMIGEELYAQLMEDVEMLDGLIEPLDAERILVGEQTPMFFGSAMTNFGVELFLRHFLEIGTVPGPRRVLGGAGGGSGGATADGTVAEVGGKLQMIKPDFPEFTGFGELVS